MKGASSGFINCQVTLIKYPNVLDCGLFKYIMYMEAGTLNTFYILMVCFIWAVKNNLRRNYIS